MATEKQWYINRSGHIEGPYSSSQLRELAVSKILDPQMLLRLGNSGSWSHAYVVKGLFDDGKSVSKNKSSEKDSGDLSPTDAGPSDDSSASGKSKSSDASFDIPDDAFAKTPTDGDSAAVASAPASAVAPSAPIGGGNSKTAEPPVTVKPSAAPLSSAASSPYSTSPGVSNASATETGKPSNSSFYPLATPPLPSDASLNAPNVSPSNSNEEILSIINETPDGARRENSPGIDGISAMAPPATISGMPGFSEERADLGGDRPTVRKSNSSVDAMFGAVFPQGNAMNPPNQEEGNKSLPSDIEFLIQPGEKILYADHPAYIVLLAECCVGLAAWLFLGFLPGVVMIASQSVSQAFLWMFFSSFTFGLVVLLLYLRWSHQFYVVTDQRTIVRRGILSVSIQILYNSHITTITIVSSLISRLLGLYVIRVSCCDQEPFVLSPVFGSFGLYLRNIRVQKIMQIYGALKNEQGIRI